jgi:plasmid stability protein
MEVAMVDILVRGVDEETTRWLRTEAERERRSMNDLTREALEEKARKAVGRREALWKEIDELRERIGPVNGDSTAIIREFRESR